MATTTPAPRPIAVKLRPTLVERFRLSERFGALAYRDYRLVFFGQAVSAVGSWMQMVARAGWSTR